MQPLNQNVFLISINPTAALNIMVMLHIKKKKSGCVYTTVNINTSLELSLMPWH